MSFCYECTRILSTTGGVGPGAAGESASCNIFYYINHNFISSRSWMPTWEAKCLWNSFKSSRMSIPQRQKLKFQLGVENTWELTLFSICNTLYCTSFKTFSYSYNLVHYYFIFFLRVEIPSDFQPTGVWGGTVCRKWTD